LLLGIFLLITIIMLVRGALQIGLARLQATEDAQLQVFQDATANSPPQYAGDGTLPPIVGYSSIRPGLPNRSHVSRPEADVTVYAGGPQPLPTFTVGAEAGLASPPWAFSAYPVGEMDRSATQGWFEEYVAESHAQVIGPLGLAPPWAP
jgi:hypothetical protein